MSIVTGGRSVWAILFKELMGLRSDKFVVRDFGPWDLHYHDGLSESMDHVHIDEPASHRKTVKEMLMCVDGIASVTLDKDLPQEIRMRLVRVVPKSITEKLPTYLL